MNAREREEKIAAIVRRKIGAPDTWIVFPIKADADGSIFYGACPEVKNPMMSHGPCGDCWLSKEEIQQTAI